MISDEFEFDVIAEAKRCGVSVSGSFPYPTTTEVEVHPRKEPIRTHECVGGNGICVEDKYGMRIRIEYECEFVNYCPYCGYKAKTQFTREI